MADRVHRLGSRVGIVPCTVDGCERLIKARGWCDAHYAIWRKKGSPTARLQGQVVNGRKVCPGCGEDKLVEEYGTSRGRCQACLATERREWRVDHPWTPVEGQEAMCECGAVFMANKRRSRYCSTKCAAAFKHRNNWPYVVARRARLREAFVETFDRDEIFERDGWICQLCDEPIDQDARFPEPLSPSLDHVIPIARGGTHERSNAQASHLGCNIRKADKVA